MWLENVYASSTTVKENLFLSKSMLSSEGTAKLLQFHGYKVILSGYILPEKHLEG